MADDLQVDTGVGTPSLPSSTPPSAPDVGPSGGDPGSSKRTPVRDTINAAVEEHSGVERVRARMGLDDDTETPAAKPKQRRTKDKQDGLQTSPDADASTVAEQSATGSQSPGPPTAWSKDAKATWGAVPSAAQAAINKRESDVEKGVLALREYYKEIDSTIGQYDREIKEIGLPPGKVINNLFGWMKAFHSNPVQTIPALMHSYNFSPQTAAQILEAVGTRYFPEDIDLLKRAKAALAKRRAEAAAKGQPQGQAQPQRPAGPDPQFIQALQQRDAQYQQMLQQFQQEIGGIKGHFAQQSQAQTDAMLANWAKDKSYFEEVRHHMAELVKPDPQTGRSIVPPKNGRVDLDAAYDYAIYAIPAIRAKVLAAQQNASRQAAQSRAQNEANAQTQAAANAARKRVSVTSSAPGGSPQTQRKRGVSVKESLEDAIKQHSGRVQ